MDQHLVYYKAEYTDSSKNYQIQYTRGIISASSYAEAAKWAEEYFGDELISFYIFPLEEGPLELTEAQVRTILGDEVL